MARAKTSRASAGAQTQLPVAQNPRLAQLRGELEKLEYTHWKVLEETADGACAALAWGMVNGVETFRVCALVFPKGDDSYRQAGTVASRAWTVCPSDVSPEPPVFAIVSAGERAIYFDIESSTPHEIDRLIPAKEAAQYKRIKADPTYRWSMKMYDRLMKGFNAFHERVYHTDKDKVSGKNDIILEIAKLLFLESFRLHHHGQHLEFMHEGEKLDLSKVLDWKYVEKHGKQAVEQLHSAFDHFKGHPDYVVTDDAGEKHPIFDRNTHLLLAKPGNVSFVLELVQNLGPVSDTQGRELKAHGTLSDVAADVLGRVFDVFLRANFESKGGLGIYLTPAPVKQAMLEIAFHDINKESPELLIARDADGMPTFRFCDPACGSYGFGAVALSYLERTLMDILGKETANDVRREKLFGDHCQHAFVGADSAPMMVTLARVNMTLLGAPKAQIFYTANSLLSDQLKPCSFDLICTNPPFGTPKFSKGQDEAKARHEQDMERLLERYRSDLTPRRSPPGSFDYEPSVEGLAMGGNPREKDGQTLHWVKSSTNIDPAVLFLDRCLQLLKPGGRLLIVLPDGVLCNSGERYVREYILGKKDDKTNEFHGGKAIVKAVISLPSDTFKLSGTGAKTSVLYLQKRKARKDDPSRFVDEPQCDVFMGVAEHLGYEVKNNVEDYSAGLPNDLAAITGAYVRGE